MQALFVKQPTGEFRKATRSEVCETACAYKGSRLPRKTIKSPGDADKFLIGALSGLEAEKFCVLFLDNRHRVISFDTLFTGTIDGTSVYPREVVKAALTHNAAAVILAHNHPSGNAEPSTADEQITQRLKQALELVDIRVLDHIVVGHDDCTSFANRGLL